MSKTAVETVTSRDGTRIAVQREGTGPPLVLVDGALCSRSFGVTPKFQPRLARHFTVLAYDRRGRGDSGDTQPFDRVREIEDLDAVVKAAGGRPWVVGFSSGAALALEAAAQGVPMNGLFAYEPPYVNGEGPGVRHDERLRQTLSDQSRGAAVRYFMREMVGLPAFAVAFMRLMPWMWHKLEAVAHTLPYDAAVMGDFSVPAERFARIRVPTWIGSGGKTDPRLTRAARLVAAAVPGASYRVLTGQTHNVSPEAMTPALLEFAA